MYDILWPGLMKEATNAIGNIVLYAADSSNESFVFYAQISSSMNADILKITASVLYPVHAVLLNLNYDFRRWPIYTDHTVVGCFSASH